MGSAGPRGEATLWAEAVIPRAGACRMEQSLPSVGAKSTHSSPVLSLQELRLQRELRGNVSQLRAFFLRSRCLDKQRVKSSCNLREHTVHSLAKDFSLLTEGQLILTGLKWSHKKSRAYSGSKGQIPTGHAAVHVPYLTQESNQYKSAVAQQFAATSRVLHKTPLVSCCHRGRGN